MLDLNRTLTFAITGNYGLYINLIKPTSEQAIVSL